MYLSIPVASRSVEGLILAIISSSTYGLIPLFVLPLLSNGMTVDSVCFYRFMLSTVFMVPLLSYKKVDFKITREGYLATFAIAIFYALTGLFLTWAYEYIASGIATTMHFLYPILISIIMWVFYKERLSKLKLFAIILAIAGVFFLCGGIGMFTSANVISLKGVLLVAVAIIMYSLYIVCVNKVPVLQNMDSNKLTFYVLVNGAIIFLALILIKNEGFSPITNFHDVTNLLILTITATLISDLALINAIKMIGSTPTSILGCMEPLTAVIIGYFVFNEDLNFSQVSGIIIVLIAVLLVIMSEQKEK